MKRIFATFVLWISIPALWPRSVDRACGTQLGTREEVRLLHQQGRTRNRLRPLASTGPSRPARVERGVVVMEADGGILSSFNDFDLDAQWLRFEPAGSGYRLLTAASEPRTPAATARVLPLDDDDTILVDLPFAFPLAGQTHVQVWVNSDGNLTFGRPDTALSPRSLGRFVAGPPRLAPLFMDLDPTRAGRVLVESDREKLVVTWAGVPEFRTFGIGAPNTFSITLARDGSIEFNLMDAGTFSAIVGVSRGGADPGAQLLDFSQATSGTQVAATVAERFSQTSEVDTVSVAQRFYAQFEDAYDYLVVYNNMGISPSSGAVAFESTVRNDRAGYADREFDDGELYGSRRRLQAFLNLGPLSQYPADPFSAVPARGPTRDTPLSIIGHEAGHLFLALASIRDPLDPNRRPMLGTQNAHWTFAFNSDASLLEGNAITDLGEGESPRFQTGIPVQRFSALDQYLMGFRAPEEVPPTFLVTGPSLNLVLPQAGVRFNGTRRDVAVEEIIQAEGRRSPDHTLAQRRFRFAFILLVAPGTEPTVEQVQQVERYRVEFEPYWARVTDGRAEADTSIRKGARFSVQPTAGVVAGEEIQIRLETARPVERDLRFRLMVSEPLVGVPAEAVVARGQSAAVIRLTGRAAGVAVLRAEPEDSAYETALTRVQVAPSRRDLQVWIRSGARQQQFPSRPLDPLLVRVTDLNRVPYPGLTVTTTARGVVLPDRPLVSDAEGELKIDWAASNAEVRELELRVEGSSAPPARAVVLGAPVVADGGVVNAASGDPGLSPGALATVYGLHLGTGDPVSVRLPGATPLGATQVELDGQVARLTWVSERQVNFLIPESVAPGVRQIQIRTPLGVSVAKPVSIEASWPGIFSFQRIPGNRVEIVATGLGFGEPVSALSDAGPLAVSGVTTPVLGLWAVTLQLPPQMTGPVTVRLLSRDRSSNAVSIPPL